MWSGFPSIFGHEQFSSGNSVRLLLDDHIHRAYVYCCMQVRSILSAYKGILWDVAMCVVGK